MTKAKTKAKTEEKMETDAIGQAAKRKASITDGEKEKKKTKAKKKSYDFTGKNALQVLHELFDGGRQISYLFESVGSVQEPCYKVVAEVEGTAFEGVGHSKLTAKRDLATKALARLRNIVLPAEESKEAIQHSFSEKPKFNFNKGDFISDFKQVAMPGRDRPLYVTPMFQNGMPAFSPVLPHEKVQHGFSQLFDNRPTIDEEKARRNPTMVLLNAQLDWMEGSGHGSHQYKVETDVQGRRFFGEGRSKQMARLNLAKTILMCMYDIHDFEDIESEAKATKARTDNPEKKLPLTRLKELCGEDELNVEIVQMEQTSEEEEQTWHATVVVKGVAYEAVGKNQFLAKLRAGKKALEVLKPKKDIPMEYLNSQGVDLSRHPNIVFREFFPNVEFTSTESQSASGSTEYHLEAKVEGKAFKVTGLSKKKARLRLVLKVFEKLKKTRPSEWMTIDVSDLEDKPISPHQSANHPIMLLLKFNPQTKFNVAEEEVSSEAPRKYKAVINIDGLVYTGEGPTKKSAKTAVARIALLKKYAINPDEYVEENPMAYLDDVEPKNEMCPNLCDTVAKAVADKFGEVFKDTSFVKSTAAFLLARYETPDAEPMFEVVSIGTGMKYHTGEEIDHKGQILNDCHGVVIACRGFRQFLFDELVVAMNKDPDTVLQKTSSGKYELKSNLKVFLFVNTAPCGDSRVFSLREGARNKNAGFLRTKTENGQITTAVRTNDGSLEGQQHLRTMSCSDKILKWNVLGMQGALLSCFLNPIYIQNTVVSLQYNYAALYRGLYKRACKVDGLPKRFCVNKPAFGTPDSFMKGANKAKATSFSYNWYYRTENFEKVVGTTGKTESLAPSRLCKLQFFDKFNEVLKLNKRQKLPKTYLAGKSMATDYQKAKEIFYNAIIETTQGKWISKPSEHDTFGY